MAEKQMVIVETRKERIDSLGHLQELAYAMIRKEILLEWALTVEDS